MELALPGLPGAYEFGPAAGPTPPVLMEPAGSEPEVEAGPVVACPSTNAPPTPDGTFYVHSALQQELMKRQFPNAEEPRLNCKVARLGYTWTVGKRISLRVEGEATEVVHDGLSLEADDRCSSLSIKVAEPGHQPVDNATDIATCVFKTTVDLDAYKQVQSTECIQVLAQSSIVIRGHSKPGSVITGDVLTQGKGTGAGRNRR